MWKTVLQNHKLWSDRFFSVISDGESEVEIRTGRQSNRQRKMARTSVCDISGATSPSYKVMWAVRNVHVQPAWPWSVRRWPAVVNLLRLVEFKTIPQPRIYDAWHQWCNTGRVFVTLDFWPFSTVCLTVFLSEFWPRIFTIELHEKSPTRSEIMIFGVQFSFNVGDQTGKER